MAQTSFSWKREEKFKMPMVREGKGREIWGLYSRETGIPAHPCNQQIPIIWYLGIGRIIVYYVEVEKWSTLAISSQIFIQGEWNSD